jgi:hypothetical protein
MSVKLLRILMVAPAVLVASAAHAQSSDKPPAETTDKLAAEPPPAEPTDKPAESRAEERSKELTPPLTQPARLTTLAAPVNPWFVRPSFVLSAGDAAPWKLTIYGFAEGDMMGDSTRSFNDGLNSNVLAHNGTQAGDNARLQFTARNSRVGFKANAPEIGGIRSSGVLEFDLFGNQPTINGAGGAGNTTEAAYFNNAAFRVRHAYVRLEDDYVDVVAGQAYHLLGWQNYFFGATCAFLGLPNELFNRTIQLRLSHTFGSDPVNFDVAAAAFRSVQRDSAIPDFEGGLRLAFNKWKGITTPGSGGTGALPAAIGLSALARAFKVNQYNAAAQAPGLTAMGWAAAGDVLIPIIPVMDSTDRGNALTLTGEGVIGQGDADQYTGMTAGANVPANLPAPAGSAAGTTGAAYTPDIDPGLVAFTPSGGIQPIKWKSFLVGLQYYLPPTGRVFVSGNFSEGHSDNIASLFPGSTKVFQSSLYADGNIFYDITPAARVGVSYQYVKQTFTDNTSAYNNRFEMTWLYFL